MKPSFKSLRSFPVLPQVLPQLLAEATDLEWNWRKQKLPLSLFLALCFNLAIAPLVCAATGETFSRSQAWALGLLGLAAVALSIYLFFVMFIPEKF